MSLQWWLCKYDQPTEFDDRFQRIEINLSKSSQTPSIKSCVLIEEVFFCLQFLIATTTSFAIFWLKSISDSYLYKIPRNIPSRNRKLIWCWFYPTQVSKTTSDRENILENLIAKKNLQLNYNLTKALVIPFSKGLLSPGSKNNPLHSNCDNHQPLILSIRITQ